MMEAHVRESDDRLFLVQPIYIANSTGISYPYEAIVDTGFTGQLALPAAVCAELGLEFVRNSYAMFGNASFEQVEVYQANVFWDGSWQTVSVFATGPDVLIGMNLLRGSSVCFDAVDMGAIEINPLPVTDS